MRLKSMIVCAILVLFCFQSQATTIDGPIPLKDINERAELIFSGMVFSIEASGTDPDLRRVRFIVTGVMRGNLELGRPFEVIQLSHFVTIRQGEEVLWYLPKAVGSEGLRSPVGFGSGSFRFTKGYSADDRRVVNDFGNMGLWAPKETLWSIYSRSQARQVLEDMKLPESHVSTALVAGDQKGCCKPPKEALPLDLLVAVAKLKPLK